MSDYTGIIDNKQNFVTGNLNEDLISFNKIKNYREIDVSEKEISGDSQTIYNKVNSFFKKASTTSEYKIIINKTLKKISNFINEAIDYYDENYFHMVNQVEDALLEIDNLWKMRDQINNKNNLYSQFVNLLQTQIKLIIVEKITKEQLLFLGSIFSSLTLDQLNQDFLINITIKMSEQNFPIFDDLL
jgi:hypothetical protein